MFRGLPLADDFHVACLHHINHWRFVLLVRPMSARLFRNYRPKPFNVDSRDDVALFDEVEVSHTTLAEIKPDGTCRNEYGDGAGLPHSGATV